MSYVDPNTVLSPKANWSPIKVLLNRGDGDASLAIGKWDNLDGNGPETVFAMRWNGTNEDATGKGNPQSRGLPTWFIMPGWVNQVIVDSGLVAEGDKPLVTALLG